MAMKQSSGSGQEATFWSEDKGLAMRQISGQETKSWIRENEKNCIVYTECAPKYRYPIKSESFTL